MELICGWLGSVVVLLGLCLESVAWRLAFQDFWWKRAIPLDIMRTLSQDDLSGKMKITTPWGKSWEVDISRNPRFYYLENSGWLKLVRDCGLGGDNELLTFTHQKDMWFNVNIFKQDGTEMIQPRELVAFLASSSRVKTEQREDVVNNVGGTSLAATSSGRYQRRLIRYAKKKAEESQTSNKRTKKAGSIPRDFGCASSSSVTSFNIIIRSSYLTLLAIPASVARDHFPRTRMIMKIRHHLDRHRSWEVVYLGKRTSAFFYGGWISLVREYPIEILQVGIGEGVSL